MIKQFRLNKNKSSNSKSGDGFDFNFFNIQALQVPKGWDKLSVSIISPETGKATSKTGKASVKHGNCRWTETLSESVWISIDEASLELEQCLFKLLISAGSSKSGILGEATVDLSGYATSKASAVMSLPLKKCNYGTVLQVEIQCLTPNTMLRNERRRNTNSYTDDVDSRSDVSDSSFNKSIGSSSSNRLYGSSRAGELGSRETSFSVSGSRPSVDSMDSLGRESFSSQSGTTNNLIRQQDSSDSQEGYIEEIRAEARMWEKNARKLQTERDGLKQEIEQLQFLLEESTSKQKDHHGNDEDLERENDDLAQQLKKAQESNLELVTCLQEMEENRGNADQNKEIKALRGKIQELENDCRELTDENLELVMKLKESNQDLSTDGVSRNSSFKKNETLDANLKNRCNDLESKCEELEIQLQEFKTLSEEQEAEIVVLLQLLENKKAENSGNPIEEKVARHLADENETEGDNSKKNIGCSSCRGLESLNKELQSRVDDMGEEIIEGNAEIEELKADLLEKQEEIEALRSCQRDLENQVSDLEKIEETIEVIQREGEVIMEKNIELESCKNELEQNLSDLEKDNVRLSQQLSGLEAQLRHSDSNSNSANLQDQMEAQRDEMRIKFEDMQKRWLEAQQECERLRNMNPKIENSAESLVEECNSLQKMNKELRDQLEEVKLENERVKASMDEESKAVKKSNSNAGSEVLHSSDAEVKKELGRLKKKNHELHKKMKCLEEEKKEWKNLVQSLEDELKQTRVVKEEPNGTVRKEVKLSGEADYAKKIQALEAELAEAVEANVIYKSQLRLMTEEQQECNSANEKKRSIVVGGENESKVIMGLEAELNDIRERYLHMSLKYAEVEEQREQLVLKLKTVNDGGNAPRWKWFHS